VALTPVERDQLTEMMCSKGPVTPAVLKTYRTMSDDAVRAELYAWKMTTVSHLNAQIAEMRAKVAELQPAAR